MTEVDLRERKKRLAEKYDEMAVKDLALLRALAAALGVTNVVEARAMLRVTNGAAGLQMAKQRLCAYHTRPKAAKLLLPPYSAAERAEGETVKGHEKVPKPRAPVVQGGRR
jgi:hypothetical protein